MDSTVIFMLATVITKSSIQGEYITLRTDGRGHLVTLEEFGITINERYSIVFQVQSCSHVAIIFQKEALFRFNGSNYFLVHLDANHGVNELKLNCNKCTPLKSVVRRVLSCTAFRHFWATWDGLGGITFGTGYVLNEEVLLEYRGNYSFRFNMLSVVSLKRTAEWRFYKGTPLEFLKPSPDGSTVAVVRQDADVGDTIYTVQSNVDMAVYAVTGKHRNMFKCNGNDVVIQQQVTDKMIGFYAVTIGTNHGVQATLIINVVRSPHSIVIPEELPLGTNIGGILEGFHPDTKFVLTGNDAVFFKTFENGTVVMRKRLDRDGEYGRRNLTLQVLVTRFNQSWTSTVHVNVADVNDNTPEFSSAIYNISLQENTPQDMLLLTLNYSDKDVGPNARVLLHFSVNNSEHTETFYIHGNKLYTSSLNLDYEELGKDNSTFILTILARDQPTNQRQNTGTCVVLVQVLPRNEHLPVWESPRLDKNSQFPMIHLSSDISIGTPVMSIKAVDDDVDEGGVITYFISEITDENLKQTACNFVIDNTTGVLSTAAPLSTPVSSSEFNLVLTATDQYSYINASVKIRVRHHRDDKEQPRFEKGAYLHIVNDVIQPGDTITKVRVIGATIFTTITLAGDSKEEFEVSPITTGLWRFSATKTIFKSNSGIRMINLTAMDVDSIEKPDTTIFIVIRSNNSVNDVSTLDASLSRHLCNTRLDNSVSSGLSKCNCDWTTNIPDFELLTKLISPTKSWKDSPNHKSVSTKINNIDVSRSLDDWDEFLRYISEKDYETTDKKSSGRTFKNRFESKSLIYGSKSRVVNETKRPVFPDTKQFVTKRLESQTRMKSHTSRMIHTSYPMQKVLKQTFKTDGSDRSLLQSQVFTPDLFVPDKFLNSPADSKFREHDKTWTADTKSYYANGRTTLETLLTRRVYPEKENIHFLSKRSAPVEIPSISKTITNSNTDDTNSLSDLSDQDKHILNINPDGSKAGSFSVSELNENLNTGNDSEKPHEHPPNVKPTMTTEGPVPASKINEDLKGVRKSKTGDGLYKTDSLDVQNDSSRDKTRLVNINPARTTESYEVSVTRTSRDLFQDHDVTSHQSTHLYPSENSVTAAHSEQAVDSSNPSERLGDVDHRPDPLISIDNKEEDLLPDNSKSYLTEKTSYSFQTESTLVTTTSPSNRFLFHQIVDINKSPSSDKESSHSSSITSLKFSPISSEIENKNEKFFESVTQFSQMSTESKHGSDKGSQLVTEFSLLSTIIKTSNTKGLDVLTESPQLSTETKKDNDQDQVSLRETSILKTDNNKHLGPGTESPMLSTETQKDNNKHLGLGTKSPMLSTETKNENDSDLDSSWIFLDVDHGVHSIFGNKETEEKTSVTSDRTSSADPVFSRRMTTKLLNIPTYPPSSNYVRSTVASRFPQQPERTTTGSERLHESTNDLIPNYLPSSHSVSSTIAHRSSQKPEPTTPDSEKLHKSTNDLIKGSSSQTFNAGFEGHREMDNGSTGLSTDRSDTRTNSWRNNMAKNTQQMEDSSVYTALSVDDVKPNYSAETRSTVPPGEIRNRHSQSANVFMTSSVSADESMTSSVSADESMTSSVSADKSMTSPVSADLSMTSSVSADESMTSPVSADESMTSPASVKRVPERDQNRLHANPESNDVKWKIHDMTTQTTTPSDTFRMKVTRVQGEAGAVTDVVLQILCGIGAVILLVVGIGMLIVKCKSLNTHRRSITPEQARFPDNDPDPESLHGLHGQIAVRADTKKHRRQPDIGDTDSWHCQPEMTESIDAEGNHNFKINKQNHLDFLAHRADKLKTVTHKDSLGGSKTFESLLERGKSRTLDSLLSCDSNTLRSVTSCSKTVESLSGKSSYHVSKTYDVTMAVENKTYDVTMAVENKTYDVTKTYIFLDQSVALRTSPAETLDKYGNPCKMCCNKEGQLADEIKSYVSLDLSRQDSATFSSLPQTHGIQGKMICDKEGKFGEEINTCVSLDQSCLDSVISTSQASPYKHGDPCTIICGKKKTSSDPSFTGTESNSRPEESVNIVVSAVIPVSIDDTLLLSRDARTNDVLDSSKLGECPQLTNDHVPGVRLLQLSSKQNETSGTEQRKQDNNSITETGDVFTKEMSAAVEDVVTSSFPGLNNMGDTVIKEKIDTDTQLVDIPKNKSILLKSEMTRNLFNKIENTGTYSRKDLVPDNRTAVSGTVGVRTCFEEIADGRWTDSNGTMGNPDKIFQKEKDTFTTDVEPYQPENDQNPVELSCDTVKSPILSSSGRHPIESACDTQTQSESQEMGRTSEMAVRNETAGNNGTVDQLERNSAEGSAGNTQNYELSAQLLDIIDIQQTESNTEFKKESFIGKHKPSVERQVSVHSNVQQTEANIEQKKDLFVESGSTKMRQKSLKGNEFSTKVIENITRQQTKSSKSGCTTKNELSLHSTNRNYSTSHGVCDMGCPNKLNLMTESMVKKAHNVFAGNNQTYSSVQQQQNDQHQNEMEKEVLNNVSDVSARRELVSSVSIDNQNIASCEHRKELSSKVSKDSAERETIQYDGTELQNRLADDNCKKNFPWSNDTFERKCSNLVSTDCPVNGTAQIESIDKSAVTVRQETSRNTFSKNEKQFLITVSNDQLGRTFTNKPNDESGKQFSSIDTICYEHGGKEFASVKYNVFKSNCSSKTNQNRKSLNGQTTPASITKELSDFTFCGARLPSVNNQREPRSKTDSELQCMRKRHPKRTKETDLKDIQNLKSDVVSQDIDKFIKDLACLNAYNKIAQSKSQENTSKKTEWRKENYLCPRYNVIPSQSVYSPFERAYEKDMAKKPFDSSKPLSTSGTFIISKYRNSASRNRVRSSQKKKGATVCPSQVRRSLASSYSKWQTTKSSDTRVTVKKVQRNIQTQKGKSRISSIAITTDGGTKHKPKSFQNTGFGTAVKTYMKISTPGWNKSTNIQRPPGSLKINELHTDQQTRYNDLAPQQVPTLTFSNILREKTFNIKHDFMDKKEGLLDIPPETNTNALQLPVISREKTFNVEDPSTEVETSQQELEVRPTLPKLEKGQTYVMPQTNIQT